jgi:Transglutaminase-like superfamily
VIAAWRRYQALEPADRRLLREAGALLVLTRVGLAILPYATLRRALDRYAAQPLSPAVGAAASRSSDAILRKVSWAVGVFSRRTPGPTTCLAQALTAHALLGRRGCPSQLRIGVRERGPAAPGPLRAHAWVESGGVVVVGALDDLAEYAVLSAPERS